MKRAHATLLPRVHDAMEALADITGRSVSSLLNEAAAEYLEKRNLLPAVTQEMLQDQMNAAGKVKARIPRKKKNTRPIAAQGQRAA